MINILIKELIRDWKSIGKYSESHSEIKFVRTVFTTAVNKKLLFEVQTRIYFFPVNQQLHLLHINEEPKLRISYLISQNDQKLAQKTTDNNLLCKTYEGSQNIN